MDCTISKHISNRKTWAIKNKRPLIRLKYYNQYLNYIQINNTIKIIFDKIVINYNDCYFFSINTKLLKTFQKYRQINSIKLFYGVNSQKYNFYSSYYFNFITIIFKL